MSAPASARARAVFLDRDGTLVQPRHYPARPEDLLLYPDIAPELRALQAAGFQLIVITNQSGIARGYFTEHDLRLMHQHLERELAAFGVRLDGVYYCPHHPDGVVPELAHRCRCRKPEPGMLLRAASERGLDLEQCWFVGDILDDVEAGNRAGCRTVLVDLGTESLPEREIRRPSFVARTTRHALQIIRAIEELGPPVEIDYRPESWKAIDWDHLAMIGGHYARES